MEHLSVKIVRVQQVTASSNTYFIASLNGTPLHYQPGQFITVIVQLQHREVRRSYSLSSTPGVDEFTSFTVKQIENGELSRHIIRTFARGHIITILPPTGRFVLGQVANNHTVFIAAGSGITPVFSLVKQLLYQHTTAPALLIYQNTSEAESMFRNELLHLQQQFAGRFVLVEMFSAPHSPSLPHQRLNNNLLTQLLLPYMHSLPLRFYLCGPQSFMRMVHFTLRALGYTDQHICQEHFYATPPPAPLLINKTPHQVTIHYRQQVHQLVVTYPHTILDVALKHHIPLPYSCRGGRCSTCTAICQSGKVTMSINDVLTPQDLANGLILTCVSYPQSNVEISFS